MSWETFQTVTLAWCLVRHQLVWCLVQKKTLGFVMVHPPCSWKKKDPCYIKATLTVVHLFRGHYASLWCHLDVLWCHCVRMMSLFISHIYRCDVLKVWCHSHDGIRRCDVILKLWHYDDVIVTSLWCHCIIVMSCDVSLFWLDGWRSHGHCPHFLGAMDMIFFWQLHQTLCLGHIICGLRLVTVFSYFNKRLHHPQANVVHYRTSYFGF